MFSRAIFTCLALILCLSSTGCWTSVTQSTTTIPGPPPPPLPHGVAVMCNAFTGTSTTASITVSNLTTHNPSQKFIAPNTTAAGVCSKIDEAARDVGFQTDYKDPLTGVSILGTPSDILVNCKEIKVEFQSFDGTTQTTGPWTDCTQ
jgi:hypothetical protein